jgi:hypothetical protein
MADENPAKELTEPSADGIEKLEWLRQLFKEE